MIYFDNAATTWPKPPEVRAAVVDAISQFGNASRGAHPPALAAAGCIEDARVLAARIMGCPWPERVAFTKNATESLNIAIASVKGHIVTSAAEHNSVLRPVYRHGDYSIAPLDEAGCVRTESIIKHCRPDTRAIVLAHASNVTGAVAPLREIGAICRERGILFIVDAAQTAGLFHYDMADMGIDALCFTGHKALYGLQGTGGICLSPECSPEPLLVGGSGVETFSRTQPRSLPGILEAGTPNAHGLAALAAGMRVVLNADPESLRAKSCALAKRFVRGLAGIRGITLFGNRDFSLHGYESCAPIVSLNVGNLDSSDTAAELADSHAIAVRAGTHCAPLLHRHFGTQDRGAVRFSFSHFNTEDEVDTALHAIEKIA